MATSAKKEVTCGYNGHYHLYMTIAVNSQDKTNNKSNVTVKMYAKSDSSTYGAYNLSSSANSVKLTVDGSQKVNKSMAEVPGITVMGGLCKMAFCMADNKASPVVSLE